MPIPILYLIDTLNTPFAGTEQHLLWLLKSIPAEEFEKHCIIFSTFGRPELFNDSMFPAGKPIPLTKQFGYGKISYFKRLHFLKNYIKKYNIKIIQAFNPVGEISALLASVWAGRKCKVIGNCRDCGYDKNPVKVRIRKLETFFRMKFIANSEAARQAANRNDGILLNAITVIRNPISFERLQTGFANPLMRNDLPIPNLQPEDKLAGMVATVRPIKDYTTLVRAAKIVLEKVPNAYFLCVGEQKFPEHLQELKQIAEELGIAEKIIWFGRIDNPLRINPLFDVAVLSTHSESFSNAVLEYAVAERPIVVSDVGGLGEIVQDGKSGFLVPPENPVALAEKIIYLLQNPDAAKEMGKNAAAFVREKYDEQKITQQYTDFYRSVIAGTR